jgi:hypothetical protein
MADQEFSMPISLGPWLAIAAIVLALGLMTQNLFPRYQFATAPDGTTVLVLDRWTGAFQRATYGADGEPRATSVLRPF